MARVPQLLLRKVDELRLHPSCARHRIAVSTGGLSALEALGELAFVDPLITTRTGFIVSGNAQYVLARRQSRATIACLEYELDEVQALRWLVELSRDSEGLNDFQRILLALDLEPSLKAAALDNQRRGGQYKGLQKLAKAPSIHVRNEIAKIAGTCSWNVDKVKAVVRNGIPEIQEEARHGKLSIHRASRWSKEPKDVQRHMLRRFSTES